MISKTQDKSVKGFIVYHTYRTVGKDAYIHLYGRLEDNRSFNIVTKFKPYFYIKETDRKKAESIVPFVMQESGFKDIAGNKLLKIVCNLPKDVSGLRKLLESEGVPCYEADIRFVYRYLIDNNLRGMIEIKGIAKKGVDVELIFEEPEIRPVKGKPKLKVMAIDIETDRHAKELYSVSWVCENNYGVLYNGECKHKAAKEFSNQKELLQELKLIIKEQDPDIITGWNVIDFDLKTLSEMYKSAGLVFDIGRTKDQCKIKIEESFFSDSKADIPGRMVLDGIKLIRMSGVKLVNYKLETAAETIVGKQKLIKGPSKYQEIQRMRSEDPERLAEYNLNDSLLVLDILDKTKSIELTIRRSMLTRMALDRVSASIASFDSLYLREMQKRKLVASSVRVSERGERIKGGYVRESKPGIYDNICVFDFKSLYPSIIRTFNIDPVTYMGQVQDIDGEMCGIRSPNDAVFSPEPGILPELIQTLWVQRDKAKKKKDDAESNAIKLLMNSLFGVLANPACRFYNIHIANAITHFGQEIIKKCAEKIEELGFNVIYGDTDSVFVDVKCATKDEAESAAEDIQKNIGEFLDQMVKDRYGCKNYLELEFERVFKKLMMPKIRGHEKGAKKRYAGIIEKNGKDELYFTGLEVVRSDWTDLAKKFQTELLQKIFSDEKVARFIRGFVDKLNDGGFDNLLIYRKSIRKPVDTYTKTTPPHIQAARKAGVTGTGLMEYVMTIDGPEPAENVQHKIDYKHYSEKQLKPIADSILSFLGQSYEDILSKSKQKSIFDY